MTQPTKETKSRWAVECLACYRSESGICPEHLEERAREQVEKRLANIFAMAICAILAALLAAGVRC